MVEALDCGDGPHLVPCMGQRGCGTGAFLEGAGSRQGGFRQVGISLARWKLGRRAQVFGGETISTRSGRRPDGQDLGVHRQDR